MRKRTYSRPNLGEGDQWAREIQTDLQAVQGILAQHSQRLQNYSRLANISSTIAASARRAVEALGATSGQMTEGASNIANRLAELERQVQGVARQIPSVMSQAVTEANIPLVVGANVLGLTSFSTPFGARFAEVTLMATVTYNAPATNTNSHLLMLNGVDVPGSQGRTWTRTGWREETLLHGQIIDLSNVPTLSAAVKLNLSAALATAPTTRVRLVFRVTYIY